MFLVTAEGRSARSHPLRPSPRVLNRAARLGPFARWWGRLHAHVFRATRGRVLRRWVGVPVLVLETVGRKSGKHRQTPVLRFDDGGDFVVVAANAGSDRTPAWFHNLSERPDATVMADGRRWRVRAEVARGEERERLWHKLLARYGGLAEYREFTTRELPVVRLRKLGEV